MVETLTDDNADVAELAKDKANLQTQVNTLTSEKADDFTIIAKFENNNLKEGANSFSIKIEPINEAYELQKMCSFMSILMCPLNSMILMIRKGMKTALTSSH